MTGQGAGVRGGLTPEASRPKPSTNADRVVVVADASVFLTCSDKTTTLSILAFSPRASEHALDAMKSGKI